MDYKVENSKFKLRSNSILAIVILNNYDITDLELLFGRSRKTLYKDIRAVKENIADDIKRSKYVFDELKIQKYINFVYSELYETIYNIDTKERDYICNRVYEYFQDLVTFEIKNNYDILKGYSFLDTITFLNCHFDDPEFINEKTKYLSNKIFEELCGCLNIHLDLQPSDDLTQHLLLTHLENNFVKYQMNILDSKVIDENILFKKKEKYDFMSVVIRNVFNFNQLMINKTETIYIALYFLQHCTQKIKHVRVLCPNGLSISKMINIQLSEYFTNFQIVTNSNDPVDLIITTMNTVDSLNCADTLVIQKIFDTETIKSINKYLELKVDENIDIYKIYDQMKDILRPEISYKEFKYRFIISKNSMNLKRSPMLCELIQEKFVHFYEEAPSWEMSILNGAKILEDQLCVDSSYGQSMIDSVKKNGPYIVLVDEFAMPHAVNDGNILKTSMSLTIYKEPVIFPKDKKVHVMLMLASVDSKEHLNALAELTNFLSDINFVSKVKKCKDYSQIQKILEGK